MARVAPFRTETLDDAEQMRLRLNELVARVNASSPRVRTVRIPNVQAGMRVVIAQPDFTVGAVLVGGAVPTAGGAVPTSAPWADWQLLGDGRISLTVNGLGAAPALYAVTLVLTELEAT